MDNSANTRRFRVNPIEVLILSLVTVLFFRSVYNLFYDSQGFKSIQTASSSAAAAPAAEARTPASVSSSFVNLDVRCEKNSDQDTTASKVRLTGNLCGINTPADSGKLIKTAITNNANKFMATVFTDVNSGKFSTDYIPLNTGKNPIRIEFSYRDGRTVTQDLNVIKN